MKSRILMLMSSGALLGSAELALADPLIEKGKEIARQHCTRCHVVGDINPHGGISSTPSFQMLIRALDDWQNRFATFHTRRPHPAIIRLEGHDDDGPPPTTQPFPFRLDTMDALLAFVQTLQKK